MHETFLVIFQVFHDFQSLSEPCIYIVHRYMLTSKDNLKHLHDPMQTAHNPLDMTCIYPAKFRDKVGSYKALNGTTLRLQI